MRFLTTLTVFGSIASSATLTFYPLQSLLRGEAVVFDNQLEHFWKDAQKYGSEAGFVVLNATIKAVAEAEPIINNFKDAMHNVITETGRVRAELETCLEERNMTLSHLSDVLTGEIGLAYQELWDEGVDPLPEEPDERAKARALLVERALQGVEKSYVRATAKLGIPSQQGEQHIQRILPKIKHVLLVTGNLIDNHPILLKSVIFAASMLLLPEIQILRPIMSLFGFGPLGPVKGSTAAWLQSRFWGGFVESGSWFSILQRVGMTLTGGWYQRVIASLALTATLGLVVKRTAGFCS